MACFGGGAGVTPSKQILGQLCEESKLKMFFFTYSLKSKNIIAIFSDFLYKSNHKLRDGAKKSSQNWF